MRATLSAYFFAGTVLSIISLTIAGELGGRQWRLAGLLLPGVVVGVVASRWLRGYLTGGWFRPLLLSLCAASALVLLGPGAVDPPRRQRSAPEEPRVSGSGELGVPLHTSRAKLTEAEVFVRRLARLCGPTAARTVGGGRMGEGLPSPMITACAA